MRTNPSSEVQSQPVASNDARLGLLLAGAGALWIAGFVAWGPVPGQDSLVTVAAVQLIALTGCLLIAYRAGPALLSPPVVYTILFALFHSGLVVTVALRGNNYLNPDADNSWLVGDELAPTNSAVILGYVALASGILVGPAIVRRGRAVCDDKRRSDGFLRLVAYAGLAMLVLTLLGAGGARAYAQGYQAFLDATSGGLLPYAILLIGLGAGLLVANGNRREGWMILALFALVALPLGLRGTVLFPVLAVAVIDRRTLRFGFVKSLAVVIAGLALLSAIQQTRRSGWYSLVHFDWQVDPLRAVAEMGYSLFPLVAVQRLDAIGYEFKHGQTLIAVPRQFIESVMGVGRGDGAGDDLLNVELNRIFGPIGASPLAEGYRNFGLAGVFAIMFMIGVIMACCSRLDRTTLERAFVLVAVLPLFIQVRNSFAPVPFQWAVGGLILLYMRKRRRELADVA